MSGTRTPTEVLEANRVRTNKGRYDSSTDASREAIQQYVDEHVTDLTIVRSKRIRDTMGVDIRQQVIGRTLSARMDGVTPDSFLDGVKVSKWRDSDPIKWQIERVDGTEKTTPTPQRTARRAELVARVSRGAGIDDYVYTRRDETHGYTRASVSRAWMRSAVEAVSETLNADLDVEVAELTKAGCSEVLERLLDSTMTGSRQRWNRPTLIALHELLVEDVTPEEVEL